LLVAASVGPFSAILVTLIKEAQSSFETSILTRATLRNIPGDAILHSQRRENLKSYNKRSVQKLETHKFKDPKEWAIKPERPTAK
jgi:hypothetical protein